MKLFQTQFVAGASLAGIATNQAQSAQFTALLTQFSKTNWTADHIFETAGGLLLVLSKPSAP